MRPTDRAALARLGEAVFAPFGDYGQALSGWLRHTQVCTVVAQQDGRAIGFSMVGPVPSPGGEVEAYLLAIAVDPSMRRHGLGRRLLDAAVREATKRTAHWGTSRLRLDVAGDNEAAIALFRSAGFVHEASDAVYGEGQEALSMVLQLV
jgi:ribosomal-protein-alanine N-acetyltransferase